MQIAQFSGANLSHVEEHRWPPLSYEQAMEKYRRDYLESDEEEEEMEKSEGHNGKGGAVAKRTGGGKTVKSLGGRERCKVM